MTLEDVARLQGISLAEAADLIERTRARLIAEVQQDAARPYNPDKYGHYGSEEGPRHYEQFVNEVAPMAIEVLSGDSAGAIHLIYYYGVKGQRKYTPYTAANAALAGGKRVGRPAKDTADQRTRRLVFLATEAEEAAILAHVPPGRNFSDWARETLSKA
jgi:hypothetical protein